MEVDVDMPTFIPGLQLSEAFYTEAVRPILDADFPNLEHAAALIGWGSDVLGYDTTISTDHHWGPRLLLFLPEAEFEANKAAVNEALSNKLPYTFRGYSTNFGTPDHIGVRLLKEVSSGPVQHMVEIFAVGAFFRWYLGYDPLKELRPADWLTFSEHRLLGSTSGKVFHDGLGELTEARERIAYYPDDVWLYMLASQWAKIAQEEAFVGRTGDVGDERGSRVIAARLVQYLMRFCFLMERKYAPYPKWFGTGFSRLRCAGTIGPSLDGVLAASSWREREEHMSEAYRSVARMHNDLAITGPLDAEVTNYYGRPYKVIFAERFVEAIRRAITSEEVKALSPNLGSATQFVDSTDLLENTEVRLRLRAVYEG
ncbi:MAG: hypothetical protein QOH93_619 [Chloroflexia bacterium]|nr:hypothetical protein [Chloroflexia bacterium]